MKKLIVLLLAFVMVGAVFAQTPALSASSTLNFGVDLDTMQFGFANTNTATISVKFPLDNASKKGDAGWWGEIAVSNLNFILSDDALTGGSTLTFTDVDGDGNPATLTAKLTNGVWALSVSSKNSLDFANADPLSGDPDVALAIDADDAGTTLSYAANGLSFGLTGTSKGDWTANASNEFALGANVGYKVSDALSLSAALAYDAFDADKQVGATASVSYGAGALSASVAADADFTTGFVADTLLSLGYSVMDGLDVAAKAYYSMKDNDVEAEASVDYAVDAIEAGVSFSDYNVFTGATYDLTVYAGYTAALAEKTSLYVNLEYTNDLAGTQTLTPYAKLTDTSVTNTTLCVEYNAGSKDLLAGKFGTLVASAKVSL